MPLHIRLGGRDEGPAPLASQVGHVPLCIAPILPRLLPLGFSLFSPLSYPITCLRSSGSSTSLHTAHLQGFLWLPQARRSPQPARLPPVLPTAHPAILPVTSSSVFPIILHTQRHFCSCAHIHRPHGDGASSLHLQPAGGERRSHPPAGTGDTGRARHGQPHGAKVPKGRDLGHLRDLRAANPRAHPCLSLSPLLAPFCSQGGFYPSPTNPARLRGAYEAPCPATSPAPR